MRKFAAFFGAFGVLLMQAHPAAAQSIPATACPTNYICSLAIAGAAPLVGEANDGHPASILGFLVFDGSGNISANLEINANGTIYNVTGDAGTCTSGTATSPGVIQTNTPNGALTLNFVVARSAASIDLLVTNHTTEPTSDTPVTVGVCHASAAG